MLYAKYYTVTLFFLVMPLGLLADLVSSKIDRGSTMNDLHYAVKRGDYDEVISLLNSGDFNINEQEPISGKTALHIAIENCFDRIATVLIEHNANVNLESYDPMNPYPLHLAVVNDRREIASKLLRAGAYVDARARVGRKTALHKATAMGLYEMVMLLVKKGADTDLYDNNGKTALDIAQGKGWDRIVAFLKKAGAKTEELEELA